MVEIHMEENCSQDEDWIKICGIYKDTPRLEILKEIKQSFKSSRFTFVHFENDNVTVKQTCKFPQERLLLYNELKNYSKVYSNFIIHDHKFLYVPDDEWKSFGNIFPKHKGIMLLYSCLEQGKKLMTNEQIPDFESPQQGVSLLNQSCHDPQYNLISRTFAYCPQIPCDQRDTASSHKGSISKKCWYWYGAEKACISFNMIAHDKRTEPGDDMAVSPTNIAKFIDRALRSTKMAIGGGMAPIKVKKAQYKSMVLMLTKMAKMMLTIIVPHEKMDIICTSLNITDIVLSVIKGQLFIKTAKGEKMKWKLSNNNQSVNMMLLSRKTEPDSQNTLMLTGNDQEVSLFNTPNEVEFFSKILLDGPKANRPEKNIERSLINREDHVSVVDHSLPKVKKSRKAVSKKYGYRVKIKHALCGTGKGKCAKERSILGEQNKFLNKMPLRNRFLKKRDKWKKKHRRIDTKTQRKRLKPLKQQKGWSWNYYENLKLEYLKDEEYDFNQVQKEHIMDISHYIREFTRLPSGEHYSSNIDVWPASRENGRNEEESNVFSADQHSNHAVQNQLVPSRREREPHGIGIHHPSQRELTGIHAVQQLGDVTQVNNRMGIQMSYIHADQSSTQETTINALASDLPMPHIIRRSSSQAIRTSSETFAYAELGIGERLPHQRNRRPDGNFQNIRPVGDIQNIRSVGNIQESRPVGYIQNIRPVGSIQDIRSVGNIRNIRPVGGIQDIRSVGNIQESRPVGYIQNIRPVGSIQDIRPVGNIQNIRPVGSIQDMRSVGNIQNIRPVGNIQDMRSVGNIQNIRPVGSIQDMRSVGNIRESRPVGNIQNIRPVGSIQDIRSVGNIRNIRPVDSIQDIRSVDNIRESRPVGNIQNVRPVGSIQDIRSVGSIQDRRPDGNIQDSNVQNRRPSGNSHQILGTLKLLIV
ncbi:uncharacterized protein LOC132725581 [Ruditapes philippinarum]|uniref:uncharacterized protein LOC132725581 n=1 Tax=Ruditapes philippinarum TaxID=129788 RepID=UPI00295B22D8|nr:uncharacterized protein LOC132725581 [Ruditapes philippinarum]